MSTPAPIVPTPLALPAPDGPAMKDSRGSVVPADKVAEVSPNVPVPEPPPSVQVSGPPVGPGSS
jgi:hypothetical protein